MAPDLTVKKVPLHGEKFVAAMIFGGAMVAVLVVVLLFGVKSDAFLLAWLAGFVAIPTQFSVTNAAITRAYAKAGAGEPVVSDGTPQ